MDIIVSTKFVFYIDYYYNYYIIKPKRIKLLIIYLSCTINSCSQTTFKWILRIIILNVLPFIVHTVIRSARTTKSDSKMECNKKLSQFKLHINVHYKPIQHYKKNLAHSRPRAVAIGGISGWRGWGCTTKRSFELLCREMCVYVDVFILCL